MRPAAAILALGIFLSAPGLLPAAVGPAKIVVFGDSTTASRKNLAVYGVLLEAELRQRGIAPVQVVNAGVGGDTTVAAAGRLERDVLTPAPALVVIQFGINDAAVDVWKTPPTTAARVPLDRFRENLRDFIAVIHARGAGVILMTPNPLAWTPALREKYGRPPYNPRDQDGLNVVLTAYADTVRQLAHEERVPLVDVARAHVDFTPHSAEPLLLDGMHPNQRGHELVARLLADLIATRKLLPRSPSAQK